MRWTNHELKRIVLDSCILLACARFICVSARDNSEPLISWAWLVKSSTLYPGALEFINTTGFQWKHPWALVPGELYQQGKVRLIPLYWADEKLYRLLTWCQWIMSHYRCYSNVANLVNINEVRPWLNYRSNKGCYSICFFFLISPRAECHFLFSLVYQLCLALWYKSNTWLHVTFGICFNNTLILGIWCSTILHLPGCFCPWTFFENIGFNTVLTDPFMSHLATQLEYSAGEFQALQLIVLAAFGVVD